MQNKVFSTYNDVQSVLDMDIEDFINMYYSQIKKEKEDRIYSAWLMLYQNMGKDNFISFEEYRDKVTTTKKKSEIKIDEQTKLNIINKAELMTAKSNNVEWTNKLR
ncbi:hypothetical protein [Clostridium grantii]|uniref:Uncharacterized protein n=1 Tax=Clostridium grantii DSM 8605 TaxID=1121316 RepID=A0A1M5SCQ9_9CLOT|nr:hypothetical protein [Clostridium grantii]SHH36068.1 hypothetical protein SAMN02745207_00860 [Clostridium grantii DSM 8605]